MTRRWRRFRRSFAKVWPHGHPCWAIPATTIPITGWTAWRDPDLHAILILFARDLAERTRCVAAYKEYAATFAGVETVSTLDLEATPPFEYAHDHFGYRDRMSQPAIEGTGRGADAGIGRALEGRRVLPRLSR